MPVNAVPGLGLGRRLIEMRREGEGRATAWLEDDFHHFGVAFVHDGYFIRSVEPHALRYPWSSCPGAFHALGGLCGQPLVARASDIGGQLDMRHQCTHLFDLAGLLSAFVVSGAQVRRYESRVRDRDCFLQGESVANPVFGRGDACLLRDGETVLNWQLDNDAVSGGGVPPGLTLGRGFRAWTEQLSLAEAEAAFVLRRAILVAGGRNIDHDRYAVAADMQLPALCHSYQPGVRENAVRQFGNVRNYNDSSVGMLLDCRNHASGGNRSPINTSS